MDELTVYEEDRVVLKDYAAEELVKIEIAMKDLKKRQDELKAALLEEMERENILSLENEPYGIKVARIEASDRETFDSKKFRADQPDLYDQYVKLTSVKPSIRITVK